MTPAKTKSVVRRLPSVVLAVALLASVGCETTVDVDLPEHEPQLVVNELFTAGSAWRVSVTESRGIREVGDSNQFPHVENATVVIRSSGPGESGGRVLDTLAYDPERRVYRSSAPGSRPQNGATYTIRVSAPGFETAEAAGRAPVPVPLGRVSRGASPGPDRTVLDLQITDPAGRANYYLLSVYQRAVRGDTVEATRELNFSSTSPLLRENAQEAFVEDGPGEARTRYFEGALFSDAAFEGQTRRFSIRTVNEIGRVPPGWEKRIFVVLTSLSEARYEYRRTVRLSERTGENPFAEPVQIHSNVRGGLGIFAGGSRTERVVPSPAGQ